MLKNHPKGLMTLFFTEMWERFGFYTMMAVFTLFMDETMGWSDAHKGQIYGLFLGFVYFTPIAGGWIADKYLGYRRTIIIGAIVLGIGYLLLAFSGPQRVWLFYFALLIMVIGNGMFKANISVLVGNLYEPNSPYKDVGYNIFYMGINLGAFVAPLAATFLHNLFGNYTSAFAAASVGMFLSIIVFEFWKKSYAQAKSPTEQSEADEKVEQISKAKEKERIFALLTIFAIVIFFWMSFYQNGFALTLFAQRSTVDQYNIRSRDISDWQAFRKAVLQDSIPLQKEFIKERIPEKLSANALEKMNKILLKPELFYIAGKRVQHFKFENLADNQIKKDVSVFGVLHFKMLDKDKIKLKEDAQYLDKIYNKRHDRIIKVADIRKFRAVNRELLAKRYSQVGPGHYLLKAETYATFNPLFILLLTPFIVGLFNWLRKKEKEPSTPAKIGMGMFISGLAMIIMIAASLMGGDSNANNVGPQWLISTYFVVTIGELFLSPMGLSFVSKVAPKRMRGLMMGGWFGATAIGSYLSGFMGSFYNTLPHHIFFGILLVLLTLAAIMVRVFLKRLKSATEGV